MCICVQDLGKSPSTSPYLDLLKIFAYETYSTCFKQGVGRFCILLIQKSCRLLENLLQFQCTPHMYSYADAWRRAFFGLKQQFMYSNANLFVTPSIRFSSSTVYTVGGAGWNADVWDGAEAAPTHPRHYGRDQEGPALRCPSGRWIMVNQNVVNPDPYSEYGSGSGSTQVNNRQKV